MGQSTKVSISLPPSLLKKVDRLRRATGETRSQLFRRAIGQVLEGENRTAAVTRYLEGYRTYPEGADEPYW
jgi:metal-responsive CopG/Arc/MetJ family transcriptional regulator